MKRMQSSIAMMVRLGDGFEAKRNQRSSRSQAGVIAPGWRFMQMYGRRRRGETPLEQ